MQSPSSGRIPIGTDTTAEGAAGPYGGSEGRAAARPVNPPEDLRQIENEGEQLAAQVAKNTEPVNARHGLLLRKETHSALEN